MLMKFLNRIEQAGNRLPHPTLLFIALCAAVLLLSWFASLVPLTAVHPVTGEQIAAQSLLNGAGLRKIIQHTVSNFVQFAPVGTVLVAMLGIGIAEQSGLLATVLKALIVRTPRTLLTFIVVLSGVLSSLGADSGYVVLIPLSAILFASAGLPPLAGIAAAFAGVSGGYSANLAIGPLDVILAGLSTEAVAIVNQDYSVLATGNYYFMLASTVLIALCGTWVTERWVLPYLSAGTDALATDNASDSGELRLTAAQLAALKQTALFTLLFVALLMLATIPEGAALRDSKDGSLKPLLSGIVVIIAVYAALAGIVYGRRAGTFDSSTTVIQSMESSMASMASYLVMMFFAAQFVNYFIWTDLGLITAIAGASWLKSLALPTSLMMCVLILLAASINLLIGSASAKWALLAPIFVPMFYLLGISPETTQMAFRVGDSCTNIITPLMPYFALVVAFVQRYDKSAGIGTVIAMMLPYAALFLLAWSLLLCGWILLDLPLGPGATVLLPLTQPG